MPPSTEDYSDFSSDEEPVEEEGYADEDEELSASKGRRPCGKRSRGGSRSSKSSWMPNEDELLTRWVHF